MAAEVDKKLLALLNGLSRRHFFKEERFTDEFLREEVLDNLSEEEFTALVKRFMGIINSLASADMDFTQLEAFLTSQMKKRQSALSEVEAATIKKFWKNQKTKIHEQLIADSTWTTSLKNFSWRVDVQTKARHIDQINQPSAIVEMKLGPAGSDTVNDVVRFELNQKQLTGLLSQVKDVQTAIESRTQI